MVPTPLPIAFATRSVPIHGRTSWESCLGGLESALVFRGLWRAEGTNPVSAAPSDSAGRVGAVVVDTSSIRVKGTNSGANRWRYATLASV